MEEFGFIDYKKPLGIQNDMRTSSYRGHIHITDTKLGNELNAKFDIGQPYLDDAELEKRRISDYRNNFTWKFSDPNLLSNPTLKGKIEYLKNFDECQLRFIPRNILPAASVSHQDYVRQERQITPSPTKIPVQNPVAVTKINIDRAKPGYAKYLDPNATTSNLTYVAYTPKELMGGIAAKDNITFWNWNTYDNSLDRVSREKDEQLCDRLAAKDCPKRRCEFQCAVKHIPHKGLTTEFRDNYLKPINRTLNYDLPEIRNHMTDFPAMPFPSNTEYKIIGSGERTQKYI